MVLLFQLMGVTICSDVGCPMLIFSYVAFSRYDLCVFFGESMIKK